VPKRSTGKLNKNKFNPEAHFSRTWVTKTVHALGYYLPKTG
jgi:hypothetical protein